MFTVKEIKEKWRNLRSRFAKFLRPDNEKKARYIYADSLMFLAETIRTRESAKISKNNLSANNISKLIDIEEEDQIEEKLEISGKNLITAGSLQQSEDW